MTRLILVVIISLIVGFVGGYLYAVPNTDKIISRLETSGLVAVSIDTFSISGTIHNINSSEIVIMPDLLSARDIVLGREGLRTAMLNSETKVVKPAPVEDIPVTIPPPPIDEGDGSLNTSPPNREIDISLSDLKVGDNVIIIRSRLPEEGEDEDAPIIAGKIILNESTELERPPIEEPVE